MINRIIRIKNQKLTIKSNTNIKSSTIHYKCTESLIFPGNRWKYQILCRSVFCFIKNFLYDDV